DRLVVAHLGAGMPDMLQVPRGERGIAVDEFRHPGMIVPSRRALKRAGPVRKMRLKTLKKILAAVVVLLLAAAALLWWLPAHWALPLLQPSLHGLRLQQVDGSVWNGRAEQVLASNGRDLGRLQWQLSHRALLGRVEVQLDFDGQLRKLSAAQVVWSGVQARVNFSALADPRLRLPLGQPQGEFDLGVGH